MVNLAYLHFKIANEADSDFEKSDHFFDAANWARLALSRNTE